MQSDTVRLLTECNKGIKMGEDAIKKVLPKAKDKRLREALEITKNTHAALGDETHERLLEEGGTTKDAPSVARVMSNMRIAAKMTVSPTDGAIADLMTDGCDMGIKSLTKYLNRYKYADSNARALAKKIIASEEYLESRMREFL